MKFKVLYINATSGIRCNENDPEMNELPMVGSRFLESPRGKHFNSLEGKVWRKVVLTSKKTILEGDYRFFAALLLEMDLGDADTREA